MTGNPISWTGNSNEGACANAVEGPSIIPIRKIIST